MRFPSGYRIVGGSRRPGTECAATVPKNINDGTLCRHVSGRPGPTGSWFDVDSMIDSAFQSLVNGSAVLIRQGMASYDVERAIIEKYGQAAIAAADKRLRRLISDIENAADWGSLNRSAAL